ncbi:unnamed protein product [Dovyalis caffra]|uniref:Kinesin motor domain-containing protein n=1 Tax=Dovyalis caffra TaxID=77055 RepID=A0AAV1RZL6_9ROSI|nr:unnamed protein product [Dovyalis caffra]
MEAKSPFQCPSTVTVRRNPHRRARPTPSASTIPNPKIQNSNIMKEISSFPIQDILAIEIPQNDPPSLPPLQPPPPERKPSAPAPSENLKKNAWPQNPLSKNIIASEKNLKKNCSSSSNEVYIDVNDSHSVTLSPPASLQESKRIKSEVYEGFSHVFASDSTQNEVFEKMVKPLVDDLLNGKNGLLAALGPSGSGKTHTVFGTPREPGMVPLALQQIFKQDQPSGSKLARAFKISVFEIYSDRGKAERISDLSPDGGDLSMQQATIKGLQEVAISSAAQAESLIACAMLKRTTAMTNSNSQSSRSQCIINIHSFVGDPDVEPNNAVLTIVDLAGAEREKRTGNQETVAMIWFSDGGSRLIESNFINNTSMVFGLCLRSLLEHQSNPKKPLQKHFKNSLLTRYLREYLEGKRRMALMLTVKPGEDDYSDTSYLLRQASPFMKIKFTSVEEPAMVHKKRHIEMLPRVEQGKKMKCSGRYATVTEEGKSVRDEHPLLPEAGKKIYTSESVSAAPVKPDSVDLPRERNHQVMQNFAKALWNVLKQYKEKLMVAEREIQSLNEVIGNEKTRYLELEKELEDFKSCCSCSEENSSVFALVNIDTKFEAPTRNTRDPRCQNDSGQGNDQDVFAEAFECNTTPQKCNSTPVQNQNVIFEIEENVHFLNLKAPEGDCSPRKDLDKTTQKCHSTPRQDQNVISEVEENVHFLNLKASECDGSPPKDWDSTTQKCHSTPRQDQNVISEMEENVHFLNLKASECDGSPPKDQDATSQKCHSTPRQDQNVISEIEENVHFLNLKAPEGDCSPRKDQNVISEMEENVHFLNLKASECDGSLRTDWDATPQKCHSTPRQDQNVISEKSLDPSISPKDVAFTLQCNLNAPDSELQTDSCCKPLTVLKPKRRLLPASSILLRDITLGIEDEPEKPKGNRGAKKSAADETKRTQGSISLLRLLQSNLHV